MTRVGNGPTKGDQAGATRQLKALLRWVREGDVEVRLSLRVARSMIGGNSGLPAYEEWIVENILAEYEDNGFSAGGYPGYRDAEVLYVLECGLDGHLDLSQESVCRTIEGEVDDKFEKAPEASLTTRLASLGHAGISFGHAQRRPTLAKWIVRSIGSPSEKVSLRNVVQGAYTLSSAELRAQEMFHGSGFGIPFSHPGDSELLSLLAELWGE